MPLIMRPTLRTPEDSFRFARRVGLLLTFGTLGVGALLIVLKLIGMVLYNWQETLFLSLFPAYCPLLFWGGFLFYRHKAKKRSLRISVDPEA
jgi:hypothetical protein